MSSRPSQSDSLAALLSDQAWLRRLAVQLVGESGAEDLAQDVLVSAIKTPPRETGASLRSWVQTVARRLAARGGQRGRSRRRAELVASRPEASDEQSEQRLLLHRRLTEAILGLEPTYRTVLVMRYLDERAPQEIAQRLDLEPATARKRISRGLVKLREVLDGEFGDRTTWMNALGPIAFGAGWKGMLPSAQAPTSAAGTGAAPAAPAPAIVPAVPATAASLAPILTLWTMKKLSVASLALCLAVWAAIEIMDPSRRGLEEPDQDKAQAGLVPLAKPQIETQPDLVSGAQSEFRSQASPIELPPTQAARAHITLVDGHGDPAVGCTGAWIDSKMNVSPLTFDEAGRADLPEAALGSLCIVRAEGLAIEDFLLKSTPEDITVALGPLTQLKGRLVVDGGPPPETVEIVCNWNFSPITPFEFTATRMPQDQGEILRQLGLQLGQSTTHTLPGGQFLFENVQPASRGYIQLPGYIKILPDKKRSRADFRNTRADLLIETAGLPYVHGRLIWADDESPYTDNVTVQFTNRRNEEFEATSVKTSESGEFIVPLEYLSSDKAEGLKHIAIRLRVEGGRANGGKEFQFPVDMETPVKDVGVLRVIRESDVRFRVVDTVGKPVADAYVVGSGERGRTDEGGVVVLAGPISGEVCALANGHGFAALDMASAEPEADGEYVIRLPQGNDLTITTSIDPIPPTPGTATFMRLDLPNELIGTNTQGRGRLNFYLGFIDADGNLSFFDDRVLVIIPNMMQPIVLPGLNPGTRVKASLHDAGNHVLARGEIVIPNESRPTSLELIPIPGSLGTIEFEVMDDVGHNLAGPWARGLGEGWLMPVCRGENGRVRTGLLAPGPYRFQVGALGRATKEIEVHVGTGIHRQKVVLYPGRSIEVSFVDPNGRTIRPEWARLQGPDGIPYESRGGVGNPKLRFANVPREELTLSAQVGTRMIRRVIAFDENEVEVRVQGIGTLRAHFDSIPLIDSSLGAMILRVLETNALDQAPLERIDSFRAGASGTWDLRADLHSGDYQVQVLVNMNGVAIDKAEATRTLFEGTVTVSAGEETLIVVSGGSNPTATLKPR